MLYARINSSVHIQLKLWFFCSR